MIAPNIKSLFRFIEFLHSNIDNFNQYNDLLNEINLLVEERDKLNPTNSYLDKLRLDEVETEIQGKYKIIQNEIEKPIIAKANETKPDCSFFNWISEDLDKLKRDLSKDDLPEIFNYKNKYLEYRTQTNKTFISLGLFFSDLDSVLIGFFNYFKGLESNEFEAFETKAIQVSDISEAVKLVQQGHRKFTLPNSFLNPDLGQQKANIDPLPPEPIEKQKQIIFKDSEIIEKIHSELKGYFPNKEAELLKALEGEQLTDKLLFPHNQNKFVEVFRRIKYNGFLLSNYTEIKNWICSNFEFVKNGSETPQPFNNNSVWDILNKGKGEPKKTERIRIDWLEYKTPQTLKNEVENEKL